MAFTLREKISESATTSVYRAYHETLGREVLLKVLHRHIASDEQARQRFVREAHACAALRSEHIVQVYDLREHDGSPAIVMEFVEGRSLKDVIADGDLRTFAFTEKVAVHVLRGLAVAHARSIFHRDIKPGNILVSPEGVVKITDFGLAQISVAPTLTAEGVVVGTPAYLAPEIVRGEQADGRTDLFSLGATLVETLTGERLFEGETYADCLNRIAQFRPEALDRLVPLCSPEFVAILKRLMDPERKRRFASPEEALAELKTTGSSRRVAIPRPASMRHTSRWVAAAAVVLIGGLYILFRPADPPTAALPDRRTSDMGTALALRSADTTDAVPGDTPREQKTTRSIGENKASPVPGQTAMAPQLPDSGRIVFSGDAGTRVSLDGRTVGELPLNSPVRVAAGIHAVVFTRQFFEPIVRTITVGGAEELRVAADFLATAGHVRCTAVPWAEISVDDVYRETTPIDRPIMVSPGTRRLRFHHPSFRDTTRTVVVAPRETLSVSVDFTR
jgi:eukaryotic-like serine/threonine-protein kinase